MGELGLNKIFGAILAAALGVMGLQTISDVVFSSGGHHGYHGEKKPFCESVKDDNAYWTDVSCDGASVAVVEDLPVDIGTLLVSADAEKGARVFKSVCSSCHTINQGGANGTGPNLYGLVGRDIANVGGFGYSSALLGVEGDWTYEQLNDWIIDPKSLARGVNMVANVKKDPDRANLIAYLAANSPNAPAFPEPVLVEEGAEEEAETDAVPGEGADAEPASAGTVVDGGGTTVTVEGADVTVEGADVSVDTEDPGVLPDETNDIVDRVEEGVARLDTVGDAVEENASDIIEEVVETVEEVVEGAEMPSAPPVDADALPVEEVGRR